jgi:hypothetical protein
MSKSKNAVKSAKTGKAVVATVTTSRNTSRTGMTYSKLNLTEKLAIISDRKKRGDNTAVAQVMGVDAKYVSAVVTGRKTDAKVINKMYNKVRGRKVVA